MSAALTLPGLRCEVLDDATLVAAEAAQRVLTAAADAIAARGAFHLVLAGGTTPKATYRLIAHANERHQQDWQRWHIWYGDERCLPVNDPERNSHMAAAAWLNQVRLPPANHHSIPAERGAEAAAAAYRDAIAGALPFDLVLLGIGEDGHTASLFPGQRHDLAETVHAVHDAPKPPPDRVSLSAGALGGARQLLVLVTGVGKRDAVRRWAAGEALPIAGIAPSGDARVLIDRAAAG